MFFDEFAVYDRPSLFYGWAERNTRPEVKSDERKRNKLNGLLCVDALSGEEFFRLSPGSKTEDVSEYKRGVVFGLCGARLHQTLHHSRAIIRLTSNHMQAQLAVHLEQMGLAKAITVECLYVPSYSPKLNAG